MGKTRPCSVCGTEVSLFRVNAHERICSGVYPTRKTIEFETDEKGLKICPVCNKRFHKYGIATHWRLEHRGDSKYRSGGGWNKGTGNFTEKSVGSLGGLRQGSGRGKSGWYRGFWCDSSWELAWVIYSLDHSLSFQRNTVGYEYEFEGKRSKFYPDFLLDSERLLEIKGYFDGRNEAKIASVPGLIVLGKEEIQPYLEYAKEKFGPDFVSSAYQTPPEYLCCDCGASVTKHSHRCAKCAGRKNAKFKIEWPSCVEIFERVSKGTWESVAKELGVSSNSIRKHLKEYGLMAPM